MLNRITQSPRNGSSDSWRNDPGPTILGFEVWNTRRVETHATWNTDSGTTK